jgi:hypothetical protein
MKLTPEAFDRAARIRVTSVSHGIPFVVVVSGRKQYMGMFWSSLSSIPTSYPYIVSSPLPASADAGCGKYCVQIHPPRVAP